MSPPLPFFLSRHIVVMRYSDVTNISGTHSSHREREKTKNTYMCGTDIARMECILSHQHTKRKSMMVENISKMTCLHSTRSLAALAAQSQSDPFQVIYIDEHMLWTGGRRTSTCRIYFVFQVLEKGWCIKFN